MSDARVETAIDWLVLLRSGEVSAAEHQEFNCWLVEDERNEAAWLKVAGVLERSFAPLHKTQHQAPVQAEAIERALLRPTTRRRVLRHALGLAALSAGSAAVLDRITPIATLRTDLHTGTGERKTFSLSDGSTLVLNARSAADVEFNAQRRLVRLRAGELIATVVPDAARNFVVQTDHGTVRALGTRFMVRQQEHRSLTLVLEHSVHVVNLRGDAKDLQTGESAWFDRVQVQPMQTGMAVAAAWEQGMLIANDESLEEVIEKLRAYRHGFIRLSPEAARLRVLGAFPLDDTDKIIESLAQTLPLKVTFYRGGWLVLIEMHA